MKKIICSTYEEISKVAADIVAQQVKNKPDSVLGFATGSSPVGLYKKLAEMNKAGVIDFSKIKTFNLDEYYPIKKSNDQSYDYFMWNNLFSHINIKRENVDLPNGEAENPDEECKRYDAKIEAFGGIDLQVLGIGRNGHIGFNEPEGRLYTGTHLTGLTPSTIEANSIYFSSADEMPKQALTMGLGTILKARKIVIVMNGEQKAEAVRELFSGRITTSCPATLLNLHSDVTAILDTEAASLLNK